MNSKIFQKKEILICCGSGGVGKTTLSAALALQAAYLGRKSIVLTIDPAKRLATALGLDTLGDTPQKISLPGASGSFHAMMLDTKRTFDRLIEKYTTDPKTRASIMNNRLYQHMSSMIAGSQEYMAMEKLYEIYHEGNFDLLVLDTPPTRHALDFLEAPKKMAQLTQNSLLNWFLKPGLFASRLGWGVLQKGAEKILAVFDQLAGFSFLHELAEMISILGGLLGGFHDRAESVYELLRKDVVGFFLIAAPTSISIQDALYFYEKLQQNSLPFSGFIVNRVHTGDIKMDDQELAGLSLPLKKKIQDLLHNYEQMAERDTRALQLLKKMAGKKTSYETIPLMTTDVHDLEGLKKINQALFED